MALDFSSSSDSQWEYDVFLSFSGDTRRTFTDHLYKSLIEARIRTFRDDEGLRRGEEIGPDLLKAIEKSRLSIIVFSRNYASSTWCLNELAHIIKCRKIRDQIVLPVFYDVEPSDLRKQKRSYEEAFGEHEDRFKEQQEKVQRWRSALEEAANLSGYDLKNKYESMVIDEIMEDISKKLRFGELLDVAANPVCIYSRACKVKSLLYDESVDNRIVGIYGMGGIGKTTIAKKVYNLISWKFKRSSFLANVRRYFDPKDVVHLQKQLLNDILNVKDEKISNGDRGRKVIEERLCNINILVVLDDVDQLKQIENILGKFDVWLSKGSRIIITTRIADLLPSRLYPQYRQHKLEELNEFESLRLFSIKAFGESHPSEEYLKCSKSFVQYCRGIPLALVVLGSDLSGKSVRVWENKLEKLKEIPHAGIQDVLEISFDSLDTNEREIFLDIACFFVGRNKDSIMNILDACGFYAIDGIDTLIRRYLVQVNYFNELAMHDLIQDMGRKIVYKQCPGDCGKRSRVWRFKEALNLLQYREGTKAVVALSLNVPTPDEISTEAFKKMKNLRLLELNSTKLGGSYGNIFKKLQWLSWSGCPLKSIPTDLFLGNLIALEMPYSGLEKVWEEEKDLEQLKFLNLSHSHQLTKISNFQGLPKLETLMLEDCRSLVEVHESIILLTKLVTLNLKNCENLEDLPKISSLVNLNLSGCLKLVNAHVFAADGTAIGQNPSGLLPALLTNLDLGWCNLSDDMIPNNLQNFPSLKHLNLEGNNFSSLPPTISLLTQLTALRLNECRRLYLLPKLPLSITHLCIQRCRELKRIPKTNNPWCRHRLFYYSDQLEGCDNLVEIEGEFKVGPVGVEILKKLLEPLGFSVEDSISNLRMRLMNIFMPRSQKCPRMWPLQGLSEQGLTNNGNGIYNLFFPGSEIPSCWRYQSKGKSVTFNVPPLQGRKIKGFIICAVYALSKAHFHCWWADCLLHITNKTKKLCSLDYDSKFFCAPVRDEEHMTWLSYWSFEQPILEGHPSYDVSEATRFTNNMEEGDEVVVNVLGRSPTVVVLVKKCGVYIVYEQNEQAHENSPQGQQHVDSDQGSLGYEEYSQDDHLDSDGFLDPKDEALENSPQEQQLVDFDPKVEDYSCPFHGPVPCWYDYCDICREEEEERKKKKKKSSGGLLMRNPETKV